MSEWSFVVPGQPPSVNHLYGQHGGRRFKAAGVEAYQVLVSHVVKLARPRDWVPAGDVRIEYAFYLNRPADCDNLAKALNDAIAAALGVNDRTFLPCTRSRVTGIKRDEARVEVWISNA